MCIRDSARYAALEREVKSKATTPGASRVRLPPTPPAPIEGKKGADYDVDDNHKNDSAHPENAHFAQGFDYVGMGTSKNEIKRTRRFMHVDRLDHVSENVGTPEEQSTKSSVVINGTEIKTSSGTFGVPDRATVELYTTQMLGWLQGLLRASTEGVYDPSHPANAYQVTQVKIICARLVFLLSCDDYLTYLRPRKEEWGIAWRYRMRLVIDFKREPITDIGLDADLLTFIDLHGCPSIEHRAHPALRALAKKHFSPTTIEDIHAAIAQHAVPPAKAPRQQPGGSGGKDDEQSGPCVLCGSTTCGNYLKPSYKCKQPIKVECQTCKKAGFPGLKHARNGPRFTKLCKDHQSDAEKKKAAGEGAAKKEGP